MKNKNSKEIKKYEELTFADDFMFCKILQDNPELCTELLELILGRKVHPITTVTSQKPIEITADAKGVRFDVYLGDDKDTVYDVEMQTTTKRNLPKRMRYYQGMIDLNLIERGAKYEELKKTYIIFICLDNPYPNYGLHRYTFDQKCREAEDLQLADEAVKMIISAKGSADDISPDLEAFLHYLATQETSSEFTKKLHEQVSTAREHKRWRGEYMTLEEKFREYLELGRAKEQINTERERARADEEHDRAEKECARANEADARAEKECARADEADARAEKECDRAEKAEQLLSEKEAEITRLRELLAAQNQS